MMPSTTDLLEMACAQTGFSDFGPDGWRDGLEHMVTALNTQSFSGVVSNELETMLVSALTARLKIEDWFQRHPSQASAKLEGPLFIFGLPRTASTALQNMLANDPLWRFLRGWEGAEPVPPPDGATERTDPRFLAEHAFIERDTTFLGKHIQTSGGPVEDTSLLRLSFHAQESGFPIHSYTRWWRGADQRSTFIYMKQVLRLLQSSRPPNRWLLKSPPHCFHLDALSAAFPDAHLVMTHRHPVALIPSVCSLHYTSYLRYLPENKIDRQQIGRDMLEHWRIGIERAMGWRQAHPEWPVIDVFHQEFNEDPFAVVRRVYAGQHMELSRDAEAAMTAWSVEHRPGVRGEHRYTSAEFGLSDGEIEDAFADYIQFFDLRR